MQDSRPDPSEALRAAAQEQGAQLPNGLLEDVLKLETEMSEQDEQRRSAQLRLLIEARAKEAQ
jgi:hypothetical protein